MLVIRLYVSVVVDSPFLLTEDKISLETKIMQLLDPQEICNMLIYF